MTQLQAHLETDRLDSIVLWYPNEWALLAWAQAVELSLVQIALHRVAHCMAGSVAWTSRFDAAAHAHVNVLPTGPAPGIVSTLAHAAHSQHGGRSSAVSIFLDLA